MPVFKLGAEPLFPHPDQAEDDGLLAVGGDLSEERLIYAYSMGIFPWYSEGWPILWWSPDPRLVLLPDELKVSRSLRQTLRSGAFTVTMDTAFEEVITACSKVHERDKGGTWITGEMIKAYTHLHHAGLCHSVESWHEGRLAGGLYGLALGSAFFGESMFSLVSDASKVAFVRLVERLKEWGFTLIDCQVTTGHLISLGAREISREAFLELLQEALQIPTGRRTWDLAPRKA